MLQSIRFRLDQVDAVRRLGAGWMAFRLRYAVERKMGLLERRTPVHPWPSLADRRSEWIQPVVLVDELREWLSRNYSDEDIELLRHHAVDLRQHRFNVFGTVSKIESWSHDPQGDYSYPSDQHWTRVAHLTGIDVKRVWEPSRFGWAYDLARLHLIDPDSGASDLFWDLFRWWTDENLPNRGVNWGCGQEASIRLMAVLLAADAMRDSLTCERIQMVDRFAEATGNRVLGNIAYARSQKNNHHTIEAAGLITVGALFPHLPNARRMLRRGVREMSEACETLVLSDGGTSQYSTNYHRVFLHGMVWTQTVLHSAGVDIPQELTSALRRATDYWSNLANPASGLVPMIGHDDGANILPLARGVHKDARPCVLLCEAAANERTILDQGKWDEGAFWVGIDAAALPRELVRRDLLGSISYEKMGIHILWNHDYRVIFRCGPFDFRPAHDDQLHVDVWWRGEALATAPGTYSYNPRPEKAIHTEAWSSHNTVRPVDDTSMRRVSNFLFSHWRSGALEICDSAHAIGRLGHTVRSIEVGDDGVTITDRSSTGQVLRRCQAVSPSQTVHGTTEYQVRVPTGYGRSPTSANRWCDTGTELVQVIA